MANSRRRSRNKMKDLKVKSHDKSEQVNMPHNDPEWYIYDKEMFDGVISMPTLEFKGQPVAWKSNIQWEGSTPHVDKFRNLPDVTLATPTVACYLMNPGLERNVEETSVQNYSAINVAGRKMYAELSASNAKTSMYAPQDISTLILALGQVIAISTHLKRMYGIATYFNFYSRRVPQDIFLAMQVNNYSAFKNGLADFRNRLNRVISKIDTIQFPAGLSYFKKCEYVYQNVFVDRDEKMVTYHLMAPHSTWVLDEESYSEGTILRTFEMTRKTPDNILTGLELMVEKILTSSTFNYIFADILNLANRNVLSVESINIDPVPIDFTVEPIYSEQFNWQVMNMSILPQPNYTVYSHYSTPYNDVYPDVDTNRLMYAPLYERVQTDGVKDLARWGKITPVRMPDTNPSQDMFVELLAYLAIPKPSIYTTGGGSLYYYNLPDYWCSGVKVIIPNGTDASTVNTIDSNVLKPTSVKELCNASQFVHFPFISVMDTDTDEEYCDITPISRMSAYTQVDPNAIRNLRYETYLGLFSFRK